MAYPERKPIYDTYKKIIAEIINSKKYKEYAIGEIDVLDQELLRTFKDIRNMMIENKNWPT